MAIVSRTTYTLDEFAAEMDEAERKCHELPVARDMADQFTDLVYSGVQRNYDEQRTADGAPWAPHAPMTVRMYGPHPILILSGAMQAASTTTGVRGNYLDVQDRSIAVGVDLPYAATHQFGDPSRNIPARPFFDLPASYIYEIGEAAANYFVNEVIG